jgi:hypothetical protein
MKNLTSASFLIVASTYLTLFTSSANAYVCTRYQGQEVCTKDTTSLASVTGTSLSQAQAAGAQYKAQQAAAKAKAEADAAQRAAAMAAAQRAAAALEAQKAKEAAALKAAQQKQRDQLAIKAPQPVVIKTPQPIALPAVCSVRTPCGPVQDAAKAAAAKAAAELAAKQEAQRVAAAKAAAELAAKQEAQRVAAAKAAAELQAKQLEAQRQLAARQALQTQVAKQVTSSGSTCNGYWQNGRCVLNGQVAFNGGSPVNVMNQPQSKWSGGGVRQTCTLVYTYKAGRVVGSPQSVCTFS